MTSVPRILYTIVATIVLVVALRLFAEIVDPEGLVWFAAFIVGMVIVSLTDRRGFGWIE